MNIFELLKNQISFNQVCSDYRLHFGSNNKGLCPDPDHDDHNPSLHNYGTHGYCFVCSKSVDIIDLEAHFKSLSPFEAAKSLADRYRIQLPIFKMEDEDFYNKQNYAQKFLALFIKNANKNIKCYPEVLQFLKDKGINEKDIDHYEIGMPICNYLIIKEFLLQKGRKICGPKVIFSKNVLLWDC